MPHACGPVRAGGDHAIPSGLKATSVITHTGFVKISSVFPVGRSQIFAEPSQVGLANLEPSGLKAVGPGAKKTSKVCPA